MDADPLKDHAKYKMTMDLCRDEVLDLTLGQIADKLSDKFVKKYGDLVMEKTYISEEELRKRVIEKLTDKIIENYRKGGNEPRN